LRDDICAAVQAWSNLMIFQLETSCLQEAGWFSESARLQHTAGRRLRLWGVVPGCRVLAATLLTVRACARSSSTSLTAQQKRSGYNSPRAPTNKQAAPPNNQPASPLKPPSTTENPPRLLLLLLRGPWRTAVCMQPPQEGTAMPADC
jgi:hypothetical protein